MRAGSGFRRLGRWYNVNIDFERCELYHIRLNFWANKNTHLDEALELLNKLEKVQVDYAIVQIELFVTTFLSSTALTMVTS